MDPEETHEAYHRDLAPAVLGNLIKKREAAGVSTRGTTSGDCRRVKCKICDSLTKVLILVEIPPGLHKSRLDQRPNWTSSSIINSCVNNSD
ncbi:hypothetical protein WMY93_011980 [Mugilogobius chulae]|uniref:Uncharacterized protein n=1 Tax=Mugilogobius chulae TaxID=88201 RepID=A0AAW0P7V5_9GOBI